MSSTPRLAPLLLLLVVCGAHALALHSGGNRAPASPWAAAELVVPGLFAQDGSHAAPPFEAPAPRADRALAWLALAPGPREASLPSPYVGLIPLCLALVGLVPARSAPRRLPGAARVVLLGLALGGGLVLRQSWLIVVGLSLPAALGLRRIRRDTDGAEVRPQLVAAGCCVLLTVALIAASLRAGFATDAQALAPLLARLDAAARGAFDPTSQALEAAHLRAVLDRAALAAFVGMTALLLHLKSRAPWSAALLLGVTAADLASAAT